MISERDIDLVARGMTRGEPSGALRARVLDALPARRSRTTPRLITALACGSALAACVFAGLAYFNDALSDTPQPATIDRTAAATPGPALPIEITSDVTLVETPSISRTVRRATIPEMSPEERAWQSRRLPALTPADPLRIDAIQPEPISIAPISMDPIVLDPVVVR